MLKRSFDISGTWEAALRAAEYVLDQVPRNSKALLIKAESLFNLCQFELALVYFHRGQSLNPELDDFRLGIQKCRKTITGTFFSEAMILRVHTHFFPNFSDYLLLKSRWVKDFSILFF